MCLEGEQKSEESRLCSGCSSLPLVLEAAGWEQGQLLPPVSTLLVTCPFQTPVLGSISLCEIEMQAR